MRRSIGLPAAAMLVLALATPVAAARPDIVSFADDDVADGEFYSGVCGFEITAESSGHVVFHNDKRGANTSISNWNIIVRLHSEEGSYFLVDSGPDMFHRRAGTESFTVSGRSLTGSTVIGRVEVDLDTGEVTIHGNQVGSQIFDLSWICDELD
jgi:hypothetical protein